MSRLVRLAPAALGALVLSGCSSYLVAFDERPLPATPVETAGGMRLDVDATGELIVRPGRGDAAALLGVGLAPTAAGLLVTHRLRADARLAPDDVIVHLAAGLPPVGAQLARAQADALRVQLRDAEGDAQPFYDFDPSQAASVTPPRRLDEQVATADEVRARPGSHPVRALADLHGYAAAQEWVVLDLIVVRDGAEVVVPIPLHEETTAVAVHLWRPHEGRWHGVDVCAVADLPEDLRPPHAEDDDLLVLRVARDSPAGRAGLRPLELVPASGMDVVNGTQDRRGEVVVKDARGRPKRLSIVPREEPIVVWIPLVLSIDSDGVRWHVGVGPLDLLYHASSRLDYSPTTDCYERTWRWSVGTSVQETGVDAAGGTRSDGGVTLGPDWARAWYWLECLDAYDEGRRRRGLWE